MSEVWCPSAGFSGSIRVAPDRSKSVWGDDKRTWIEASPPRHLGPALPSTLLIYADGDEPARRRQNIEMAQAMRAAGNEQVELVEVAGRDHISLWNGLDTPGDEVAERIIAFVRATQCVR